MPFHPPSYTKEVWKWMDGWYHFPGTPSISLIKTMSECYSIHFHIQRGEWMASPCSPSLSLSFVMGVKGCSLTHTWGMSGWMGDKHSPCSSSISFTRGVSRCHSIHLHIQRKCESNGWLIPLPLHPLYLLYKDNGRMPYSIHLQIQRKSESGITLLSLSFSLFVQGVKGCHSIHLHIQRERVDGWVVTIIPPCPFSISFTKGVNRHHSIHLHIQRKCESGITLLSLSFSLFVQGVKGCHSIHLHIQRERMDGWWQWFIPFVLPPPLWQREWVDAIPSTFIYKWSVKVDGWLTPLPSHCLYLPYKDNEWMPFHSLSYTGGVSGWMASPCSPSLSLSFVMGEKGWHSIHLHIHGAWVDEWVTMIPLVPPPSCFTEGASRCHIPSTFIYNGNVKVDGWLMPLPVHSLYHLYKDN